MARAACGHASCTLLGVLSLVLADPVGKTHGADVFQKSLDYKLYKQRIEAVIPPHVKEELLIAPYADDVVISPSPTM